MHGVCSQGELTLWDVSTAAETGTELCRFGGHTGWVNAVAFSPESEAILSGSGDQTAILWDVTTGEAIRRFEGHRSILRSPAFSPDGRLALSYLGHNAWV